jgi:hypothetical protein
MGDKALLVQCDAASRLLSIIGAQSMPSCRSTTQEVGRLSGLVGLMDTTSGPTSSPAGKMAGALMNVHATAFLQTFIDYRPNQELQASQPRRISDAGHRRGG